MLGYIETLRLPRGSIGTEVRPAWREWDGEGRKSWGRRDPSRWNFDGNLGEWFWLTNGDFVEDSGGFGGSPGGGGRRTAGRQGHFRSRLGWEVLWLSALLRMSDRVLGEVP